jgi:signal transduction histidine kinase/CheY-like chemotaxis protein
VRDPVVLLALAIGILSFALVGASVSPDLSRILERASDGAMVLVTILAFQLGVARRPGRAERFFWHLWTAGLGAWLGVRILDVLVPPALALHPDLLLLRSAGFTALYLAAAIALELRPHARPAAPASAFERLDAIGAVVLAFGLFAYFALIPALLSQDVFQTAVPGMLLYLFLDIYLAVRLVGLLRRPETDRRWRRVFGWMLAAVVFWAAADGAESLRWAGLLSEEAADTLLNVLWMPPFLALVVAARRREPTPADRATRVTLVWDGTARRRTPLVLQAATLPLLHFVLLRSGVLDAGTTGAREVCAIAVGLVLGVLAVVYQRWIERENADLVAARVQAAEAASEAKSRFVARMSHELRTPLNGVLGTIELLLESELSRSQRRLGDILHLSAHSLMELVNEVLDFSRIEAGRLEVESVPLSPRRLAEEVTALMTPQAEHKGLALSCRVHPDVPERRHGDPTRLRQILVNLVGNAIKFTEEGVVRLRVEPGEDGEGGQDLVFEVSDSGVGIAPEVGDRIFEAFAQAEGSTNRLHGGTGLGLAISRELARLMGGDLTYESEPDVGTTFRLTARLAVGPAEGEGAEVAGEPAARVDALPSDRPDPERREKASEALETPTSLPRVLVVDDNAVNLEVACAMLRLIGCEADVARDGRQALARLGAQDYDAVFMDCLMPVMDGLAATAALRTQEGRNGSRHRTVVIALTASATKEDRERCLAAGMDDYLAKPFRRETLEAVLRRWVPALGQAGSARSEPLAVEG